MQNPIGFNMNYSTDEIIEKVKTAVTEKQQFKYHSEVVGFSFKDFFIIDTISNEVIQVGSETYGMYYVMIEVRVIPNFTTLWNINSVFYDLRDKTERLAQKRLELLKEEEDKMENTKSVYEDRGLRTL